MLYEVITPHEGENSFEQLKDKATLEAFFAQYFPDRNNFV